MQCFHMLLLLLFEAVVILLKLDFTNNFLIFLSFQKWEYVDAANPGSKNFFLGQFMVDAYSKVIGRLLISITKSSVDAYWIVKSKPVDLQ